MSAQQATMGGKSVETLGGEIWFSSILESFPRLLNPCWFFYFWDSTDHSTYTTLNWVAGGIRKLMLVLWYWEASFSKGVSTTCTFVAHYIFQCVHTTIIFWKLTKPLELDRFVSLFILITLVFSHFEPLISSFSSILFSLWNSFPNSPVPSLSWLLIKSTENAFAQG